MHLNFYIRLRLSHILVGMGVALSLGALRARTYVQRGTRHVYTLLSRGRSPEGAACHLGRENYVKGLDCIADSGTRKQNTDLLF
jgi:hypothetical protein